MIYTKFIVVLFFIMLACNDQSIKNKATLPIKRDSLEVKEEINNNCLILANPEWVYDATYHTENDIYQSKYDRIFLFAFVKNVCVDTLEITTNYLGLYRRGLYISYVDQYYKKSEARTLRADTQIDSIYKLLPNDSIYLGITEFNSFSIEDLDYLEIIVEYKKGDTSSTQSIPVFSYSITSNSKKMK